MATKLFSLSTNEGYQVKILSELLSKTLIEFNLTFSPTTITLRESDAEEHCILDVELRVEDLEYTPPTSTQTIGMTAAHLHKVLKRIKKKDKLSLYIDENEPTALKSRIVNADKERNKEAMIRLKDVPISSWQLPTYPQSPITTILSAELQRQIKEMMAISSTLLIQIQERGIKFTACLQSMTTVSDIYGAFDEDQPNLYERKFSTKQFSKLSKMTGLSPFFRVFMDPDQDILKFTAKIGSIGVFSAYLLPKDETEIEIGLQV